MRVFCSITFHGYGHLAQMVPVMEALQRRLQGIQWIVQSAAPRSLLQGWLSMPFEHVALTLDQGPPMHNAIGVDVGATYRQFSAQHTQHRQRVERAAALLKQHKPDLVLTDISHLLSAAAAQCGIPCVHVCSLNWADTFLAYCGGRPMADEIYHQLCDDYSQAECFYALTPGMPMPNLTNVVRVGPVCRQGRKLDLARHFDKPAQTCFVLVSLGGMPYPVPFDRWPRIKDRIYISGRSNMSASDDIIAIEDTGLNHLDVLTSCNVLITKPGYGMFAEAACAGKPVLYLPRGDWPEEPWLIAWQQQHGFCQPITDQQLQQGDFEDVLQQALQAQLLRLAEPSGIGTIADGVISLIQG